MKNYKLQIVAVLFLSFLLFSCSGSKIPSSAILKFDSVEREIKFLSPAKADKEKFNSNVIADTTTVIKDEKIFSGYVSDNKLFLEEIIKPIIENHSDYLKKKHPVEIVNALAVFGFEIYQAYFGQSFYRWGGDIFDLDDPQNEGIGHKLKFGLDCSGYTSLPYELAVYFNLIEPEIALYSSKGFEIYCRENSFKDTGGRGGTSNNFRLDTKELDILGKEIFRIEKDEIPTDEMISRLQPGDILGRNGHYGIVVELQSKLYYLESGGWVVPVVGGYPVVAKTAVEVFARNGYVSARRCLPDWLKDSY